MNSLYYDPKYPLAGLGDMVFVNGVALRQVGSKAQVVAGTFYVDAARNKLYIGSNPAGKTVESTAKDKAFGFWSTNSSNLIIRGLGFAHFARTTVDIVILSVRLENNIFAWNGLYGAKVKGRDNVAVGNSFSYNADQGLGADQADRLQLTNNRFSYNNTGRFIRNWMAAGTKIINTDGAVVSGNIAEHNLASGIWLDVSVTNAKIANNISRYNDGASIFFELSHKAIIAANIS